MLKRTPFHSFHESAGGRMVDFAGWEMPILYRGIVDEHEHTRNSGSMFDVSHMGRLSFAGKDAVAFLDRVLTRQIVDQRVGQSRYSLVCSEAGGVLAGYPKRFAGKRGAAEIPGRRLHGS